MTSETTPLHGRPAKPLLRALAGEDPPLATVILEGPVRAARAGSGWALTGVAEAIRRAIDHGWRMPLLPRAGDAPVHPHDPAVRRPP